VLFKVFLFLQFSFVTFFLFSKSVKAAHKMLVKLTEGRNRSDEQDDSADHRLEPVHTGDDEPHHASGVNFTKVLRSAFTLVDPGSVKKYS